MDGVPFSVMHIPVLLVDVDGGGDGLKTRVHEPSDGHDCVTRYRRDSSQTGHRSHKSVIDSVSDLAR